MDNEHASFLNLNFVTNFIHTSTINHSSGSDKFRVQTQCKFRSAVPDRNHSIVYFKCTYMRFLFYLQNQINDYKQTTKSAVCVNYDYSTVHKTAVSNSVVATSLRNSRENPGTLLNSYTILLVHYWLSTASST